MTNDLFRDLLDNRIPGHETPTTVWVDIMPRIAIMGIPRHQGHGAFMRAMQMMQEAANNARAMMALESLGGWVDYGAQLGIAHSDRVSFNRTVEQLARTTGWSRADSARNLGIITDAAEKADLRPLHEDPPADPRARALWAKQQQGHGPAMTPLRVRGRNNRYKEKS